MDSDRWGSCGISEGLGCDCMGSSEWIWGGD